MRFKSPVQSSGRRLHQSEFRPFDSREALSPLLPQLCNALFITTKIIYKRLPSSVHHYHPQISYVVTYIAFELLIIL